MQENLDWADLITLDFSLLATPEGKQQLAQSLLKAVREDGFFYVKNFNISQERVNRQFSLGKRFYELPLEEKLKYWENMVGAWLNVGLPFVAELTEITGNSVTTAGSGWGTISI